MSKKMKAVGVVLGIVVVIGGSVLGFFVGVYGKRGREGKAANKGLGVGAKEAVDDPLGCSTRMDEWGRPLVSIRSREGDYYCRSLPPPEQMDEIERVPRWVLWGKKVWADDWTPCPYPIKANRCDDVGVSGLGKFCIFSKYETLVHEVEVLEDTETGDFLLMGYGKGPAVVGVEIEGKSWSLLPRDLHTLYPGRGQGVVIDDVRAEDFVIVECIPQGDITFELLDEWGRPLERMWTVSGRGNPLVGRCPPKELRRLCRVFADRDVEVKIAIDGVPPEYRVVRAKKGKTTHYVFVVQTEGTAQIEGYAWDVDTGLPLEKVAINVYPHGEDHYTTYTDASGYYRFTKVKPGRIPYVAPIFPQGERIRYENKVIREGQVLRLDFPLKKGLKWSTITVDPPVEFVATAELRPKEQTIKVQCLVRSDIGEDTAD